MESEPIYEEIPFMQEDGENHSSDSLPVKERPRLRRDFLIAAIPFFWQVQRLDKYESNAQGH
jgi:hypothetical protein